MIQEISLENVGMKFFDAKGRENIALQNIDLKIKQGEFVSLLGPSGCGKTTMLRLIADLQSPTTGKVIVNGRTPREARLAHEFSMVFQSPVLYDWRTVEKNVMLPLELSRTKKEERKKKAHELLKLVGLEQFAGHYPFQLSGGMQQRVGIARALSVEPKILLMDEPFSALDEFTRLKLNEDLLRIWRETDDTTIVFVTHSIAEAVFLSTKVVVLSPHPGRISNVVDIKFEKPRNSDLRETPEFQEYVKICRESFENTF